jgi:DHA1 family bicyclomycin/chloramphenicol resistance-like MFS transporter
MAAFFIYLANSSFVLIEHYGLTPRQYSLAFAFNAASFIGVSQFAGKLAEKYGLPRIVSVAVLGFAVSMVVLAALNFAGLDGLAPMIVVLLVGFGFLGLVVPTTSVMALDDHGEISGAAAAPMGTLQLVLGAVVIAVMGVFVDGTAHGGRHRGRRVGADALDARQPPARDGARLIRPARPGSPPEPPALRR